MHDANGTPLKVGDIVNIPCVIQQVQATDDFCNIFLETILGRRPDGQKDHFGAINTAQVVLVSRAAIPVGPDGPPLPYPASEQPVV